MRIAIVSIGTLGDIVPYIALGKHFIAAGDQVKIITFKQFEPLIRESGCEFHPFSGEDLPELLGQEKAQARISQGSGFKSLRSIAPKRAQSRVEGWMLDTLAGCQDTDVIIGQMLGHLLALPVAEKLNIPYCAAFVFPLHRTRAFPNAFSLFPSKPGWHGVTRGTYNWWTHTASTHVFNLLIGPLLKKAGSSALGKTTSKCQEEYPILYGYSPALLPKPKDWNSYITVTGYWAETSPKDWQPTQELADFLAKKPTPIYVGFGSMTGQASRKVIEVILQALKIGGQRVVLLLDREKWPELELPETVLCLKSAPHEWLFPQMAAVIHHGGAGTTRAALHAGVPQIIVPFIADQSFWGYCLEAAGLAPAPLRHKHMSLAQVQTALTQVLADEELHARIKHMSKFIKAEQGVEHAMQQVHNYVHTFKDKQLTKFQQQYGEAEVAVEVKVPSQKRLKHWMQKQALNLLNEIGEGVARSLPFPPIP